MPTNSSGLDCTAAHASDLLNSHIFGSSSTMLLSASAAVLIACPPRSAAFTASSLIPTLAAANWSANARPISKSFSLSAWIFSAPAPSTSAP